MATISEQITSLYVGYFHRAPDAAGLAFWSNALANGASIDTIAGGFVRSPESQIIYTQAQTAEQFVAKFYQTVFGRAPDASGLAFWTNSLNSAGGIGSDTAKALLVSKIIGIVSTPLSTKPADLSDAQYAETVKDRAIFAKKIVIGIDFAVNQKSDDLALAKQAFLDVTVTSPGTTPGSGSGSGSGSGVTNQVFNLTLGVDKHVGGAGNDTFNGNALVYNPVSQANEVTLTDGDVLDGGAGTDTLNARITSNVGPTVTLSNIEVVNVASSGADSRLDLAGLTAGLTQANFVGSTQSGTLLNVGNAALMVSGQSASATFGGSTATDLSLTLSAVGVAKNLTAVSLSLASDLVGPLATKHTIVANNANVAFSYGKAGEAVTSMTVAATGSNALTLASQDAATVTSLIVTGAGSVDFSGRALSALTTFTGSTGNDKVTVSDAPLAGTVINGGAGSDTFGIDRAGYATYSAYDAPTRAARVFDFEALTITDMLVGGSTTDLLKLGTIDSFIAANGVATGTTATVTNLTPLVPLLSNTGTINVGIHGAAANDGTLALSYVANGMNNWLNLTLNTTYVENNDTTATITSATRNVDANLFQLVNVVSTGTSEIGFAGGLVNRADGVHNTLVLTDAALATLNVSGDQAFTFNTTTAHASLSTINASALRANANINASQTTNSLTINGASGANTIVGGSGNDTITGGSSSNNISSGAGNDTIISGSSNDVIDGGDGNDSINGGGGADRLTGGAGNDGFIFASLAHTRNAAFSWTDTTIVNIAQITDFTGNGNLPGDQIGVGSFGGISFNAFPTFVLTAVSVASANNFVELTAGVQQQSPGIASSNSVVRIYDVTVDSGTLMGHYVIVNDRNAEIAAVIRGVPGVTDDFAASDMIISVVGTVHESDFAIV